ncbi:hypothetical protein ACFFNY_12545 [Paenibacillus hodogayensis]|uniref:Uncharacterized protein n=1 Tax=Paenibacillus hodogayensis TaxID=279208 RepID=A0ABV5VVQ7_9BACL
MRRSKKEMILLEPANRMLHNDVHESAGMQTGSFAVEASREWAFGQATVKHATRKPLRP